MHSRGGQHTGAPRCSASALCCRSSGEGLADLYTALQPHIDRWRRRIAANALLHGPRYDDALQEVPPATPTPLPPGSARGWAQAGVAGQGCAADVGVALGDGGTAAAGGADSLGPQAAGDWDEGRGGEPCLGAQPMGLGAAHASSQSEFAASCELELEPEGAVVPAAWAGGGTEPDGVLQQRGLAAVGGEAEGARGEEGGLGLQGQGQPQDEELQGSHAVRLAIVGLPNVVGDVRVCCVLGGGSA